MSTEILGYDGILFIGDVHGSSSRPGRRIDDYANTTLKKLTQCAHIANERHLYPVFLGDLFHKARENDLSYLSQMMATLRMFHPTRTTDQPIMVGGSHDRTETQFTDKDAAQFMAGAGCLRILDTPGKALTLRINGVTVNVWAVPAGCPIPSRIEADPHSRNIMITHHDFDFQGRYPQAIELREIENVDMLVNGHMHTPTPMVLKGRTACHNPGSITRVSVDLKNHRPVVSVWSPAHGVSLEKVALTVEPDVFDLTGKEVFSADNKTLKASMPKTMSLSRFAEKLRKAETLEAGRTSDGAVLAEELHNYFELFDKPDALKRYLTGLFNEVVST